MLKHALSQSLQIYTFNIFPLLLKPFPIAYKNIQKAEKKLQYVSFKLTEFHINLSLQLFI